MKKSDVLLVIEQCLVDPHFPDDPAREAKYILKRIEQAGMIPMTNIFQDTYGHLWEEE